jgi:hypothetical protein
MLRIIEYRQDFTKKFKKQSRLQIRRLCKDMKANIVKHY